MRRQIFKEVQRRKMKTAVKMALTAAAAAALIRRRKEKTTPSIGRM